MNAPQHRRNVRAGLAGVAEADPAILRGVTVVVALLASLGVSWAAGVDVETIGLIATALTVLAPLVQAVWTRAAVFSPATVRELLGEPGDVPGR